MLEGKTVLLGVSGSIAAYKSAYLASALKKLNCDLHVLMTKNATHFVTPITFETLSGNKAPVDTFDRNFQFNVEHVSLAKLADIVVIAPATANVIAKLAYGIADDMLTTTVLACTCPKMIAPAMNSNMYHNPVTQENLKKLQSLGWKIVTPGSGILACGDIGDGRMAEPEEILEAILHEIAFEKDMKGLKVLVSAGPTKEYIDPVRFISNPSSGKMGYSIARAAAQRGAEVTLVSGETSLEKPSFVEVINVISTKEMFDAVTSISQEQDIIIKAAAVSDYTPAVTSSEKVKKSDDDMSIALERTPDILKYLGENRREGQFLCGFSMETENLIENSKKKLINKKIDMIVANNLKTAGAGFAVDTNVLTIITKDEEIQLPKLTKYEAAHKVLDIIMKNRG
ncbi:MAG: bifunctional phosphopantothenoylcysteine decarboxylase/phosphopantothenate--cysteine ligase CoaBC [Clostridiales bacterium]|nr:bifunctional phosphopantothenoylcysteine decarboxylase/phosphopantothenate--cysteine ligase CoaBC [Clostridiales bacterium]